MQVLPLHERTDERLSERGAPLPGDLISALLGIGGPGPLPERDRGLTDPESIAEFLVFDIPFEIEPAVSFGVPEK